MKIRIAFDVLASDEFSKDEIVVTGSLDSAGVSYEVEAHFTLQGSHLAELRPIRRDFSYRPGTGLGILLEDKVEEFLLKHWKENMKILLSTKQARVEKDLEAAQARVEALLLARENLQKLTGE